jgi:hypothetical protein
MGIGINSGAVPAGAWTSLAKGTGAMDITAIPTGYKFLKLIVSTATTSNAVSLRFNADTGNNYFYALRDTAIHGESQDRCVIANSGANFNAFFEATIVNIATAPKHLSGVCNEYTGGATSSFDATFAGTWTNSTDEINRITMTAGTPVYWALFGAALI